MTCVECKSSLAADAKFCSNCGTKVDTEGADSVQRSPDESSATVKLDAVKQYATDVAHEAGELSKSAIKSDLGKKMAAGAALGAVIAVPVPFVGPAVGAVVGAGIVAFRRLTK